MKRHLLLPFISLTTLLGACTGNGSSTTGSSLSEAEYVAGFCAALGSFQRVIDNHRDDPQSLLTALPGALTTWLAALDPLDPPADFAPIHERFDAMLRTAEAQRAPAGGAGSTEEVLGTYLGPASAELLGLSVLPRDVQARFESLAEDAEGCTGLRFMFPRR